MNLRLFLHPWNNQLWAKQDGKWGLIDLSDAKKQAGLEVAEQDEPPQESEEKEETIDSVEYSIERDDRSIRDAERELHIRRVF